MPDDELLKVTEPDDPLKIVKKKDPLAAYRDKSSRNMCAGCDFDKTFKSHKHLQNQSVCRNCVVTGMRNGEAVPDPEEGY
ncbi:MAG: hypothetical protein KAV87_46390 [Desulfobacteraceae bacterium]|nr:hypothetical protein [Desulfobacteraceae bacterium]